VSQSKFPSALLPYAAAHSVQAENFETILRKDYEREGKRAAKNRVFFFIVGSTEIRTEKLVNSLVDFLL
jgi:arginine/lysine/ornithine decarboxylase